MNKPNKLFCEFASHVYSLSYLSPSQIETMEQTLKKKLETIASILNDFTKSINTFDEIYIDEFVYNNYDLLRNIRQILLPFRQMSSKIDQLYLNTLYFKQRNGLPITKLFLDFVKGVTYFEDEEQSGSYPVYHRISACGPP